MRRKASPGSVLPRISYRICLDGLSWCCHVLWARPLGTYSRPPRPWLRKTCRLCYILLTFVCWMVMTIQVHVRGQVDLFFGPEAWAALARHGTSWWPAALRKSTSPGVVNLTNGVRPWMNPLTTTTSTAVPANHGGWQFSHNVVAPPSSGELGEPGGIPLPFPGKAVTLAELLAEVDAFTMVLERAKAHLHTSSATDGGRSRSIQQVAVATSNPGQAEPVIMTMEQIQNHRDHLMELIQLIHHHHGGGSSQTPHSLEAQIWLSDMDPNTQQQQAVVIQPLYATDQTPPQQQLEEPWAPNLAMIRSSGTLTATQF